MRLRARLALSLTTMLAVLALLAAWLFWLGVRDEIKAGVSSQLFALVSFAAQSVDNDLRIALETTHAVAVGIPAPALASREALAQHMGRLPMPMGALERCIAVSPGGMALAQQPADPPLRNQSFADREYFRRAMETRQPVVSRPFRGAVSGMPVVVIAAPRLGAGGEVELVMQCSLYLLNERLFGDVRSARFGSSGYLYVASRDRMMVIHPDRSRVLAGALPTGANPSAEKAREGFEGTEEGTTSAGLRALMGFKQLKTTNWYVAGVYPADEAYAPLKEARNRVIAITLASLLAGGVFAWLLAGLIVGPLLALTRHIGGLRDRPETVEHDLPLRNDEIGALAKAFNGLLSTLREREASLRISEEKFVKAFQSNPDFILISRLSDGLIVEANSGFESMTGYAASEVIGRRTGDLGLWADAADREVMAGRLREEGSVRDLEARFVARDGRIHDVLNSATIIELNGEPHIIGTSRDITELKRAQDALRHSEERFAKAFNANPNYATVSRLDDGRFVAVNKGFERLTGWKAQEVLGRTAGEIGLWADLAEREELVRHLKADGEWLGFKVHFRKKDGEVMVVEGSCVVAEIGGEPQIIGVARDITEVQRAEAERAKSEEKFSKAFHASPDWITILRQQDGLIIDANEGFERVSGFRPDEAIGHTVGELGLWADPGKREAFVGALNERGRLSDYAFELRRKDGGIRQCVVSAVPIEVGGEPCMISIVRDVTEQRRAEEDRTKSEEKFATVFHASPDGIMILRAEDGLILDLNESYQRMFGCSREEVVGRTVLELGLWAFPERRARFLAEVKAMGRVTGYEFVMRTRQGALRDVTTSSVLIDIGGVPCMISIVRDVTDRLRAEEEIRNLNVTLEQRVRDRTAELEEAVREMESFSYSISHDLRAPLRAIAGYAKIVEEDYAAGIDAEGKKLLARIAGGAIRMGELIDDLLDFSRIGRAELKMVPVDMQNLARDVLGEISEAVGGLHWIDIGALPPAVGDRGLLRQVWANLLSNAIKYSRQRDPARIEVGGAVEGHALHYWVRDNGAGFDMAYADKLFKVFQRLHRDPAFEGTGVGLAIVARIVQRHGGRVWAEGTPDQGATFHFTLPSRAD